MNNIIGKNLVSAVIECDKHVQKLQRSLKLLTYFPLSESSMKNLSELETEHIDQMIFRFSRLQDAMGKKLLPSLFYLLEPEHKNIPFIDILNHLEKLDVIESAEAWQEGRFLRNNLAHDYPDQEQEMIQTLNMVFERLPDFLRIYNRTRTYIENRNYLPK